METTADKPGDKGTTRLFRQRGRIGTKSDSCLNITYQRHILSPIAEDKPVFARSFSGPSLLQLDDHYDDLGSCFTRNIGKGFTLGFGGKVLLNVVRVLFKWIMKRDRTVPNWSTLLAGSKEYGMFLGSLLGIHNTVMYITRKLTVFPGLVRYRGMLAGLLAGTSISYLPKKTRWTIIYLTLPRAFELLARMLVKRGTIRPVENADVLLMMASSGWVVWAWLYRPDSMDQSYLRFLTNHVGVPKQVVEATANMQVGKPVDLGEINLIREKLGLPAVSDPFFYDKVDKNIGGVVLHPHLSYVAFLAKFVLDGFRRAVPVYLPVYIFPLLFRFKRLIKHPQRSILHFLNNVTRSSLFLACYCAFGVSAISVFRSMGIRYDVIGRKAQVAAVLCGVTGGLCTFMEKKGRRVELALYVLTKALESVFKVLDGTRIPKLKRGDVWLFSCALALIMHTYTRYPTLLRGVYRSVLSRFFDSDVKHHFWLV